MWIFVQVSIKRQNKNNIIKIILGPIYVSKKYLYSKLKIALIILDL